MKVLAALALIVSSVSALGSGPYLPSGWRPDGPAFFLPSEPRPPVAVPPQDFILQGSEALSSDFLREYGPPAQNLPEVVTEQAFLVVEAKVSEEVKSAVNAEVVEAITEVVTDAVFEDTAATTESAVIEVTETQAQPEQLIMEVTEEQVQSVQPVIEVTEEQVQPVQPVIQGKSLNLDVEASVAEEIEGTTQADVETIQQALVQEVAVETVGGEQEVEVKSAITGEVKTELVAEVKTVAEEVKNIAEAIVSLEKEVVAEQVLISQDLTEVKSIELATGSVDQVPEGFLEYGPPGFKEYGPPNVIPRNVDDVKSEAEKIDSNETRRRRFSPKFRSTKAKKH